jgi:peptide/nickel transport system ATP-binding protein
VNQPLIELDRVTKRYALSTSLSARLARSLGAGEQTPWIEAVSEVDVSLSAAEVVGLVGESGCGKSTLGRIAAGLLAPTSGVRRWNGRSRGAAATQAARSLLGVQMIFQDTHASLNPRMRVADIVGEAPVVHGLVARSARADYVAQQLTRVGLDPSLAGRFPHQFSGGQRSRIGIARALAVGPEVLVCDEAVAALDVSVQAQVLNLFLRLREELGLTYLFISHDLSVVRHLSDRVLIMYLGRIVESAPTEEIFLRPNHPYTQALLAEIPRLDLRKRRYVPVPGEIPSPSNPPPGCHFHPRCPHAFARCRTEAPPLKSIAPDRYAACHLNDQRTI